MGSKPLQDAFLKLGIGMKELASPDTEKIFEKAVSGIAKLGDIATATNVKVQLFGKGMRQVDMTNFNDLIKEGNGAWEKYADAVAIAADLHDKLAAKGTRTTLMFTAAFLPALNTTFDALNKVGSAMEDFMFIAGLAFKAVIYDIRLFVTALQTINAAVNLVGLTLDDMANGKFNTFSQRLKEYDVYVAKLRQADRAFANELMNPKGGAKKPNTGTERATELNSEAKKLEEMLNIAKLISVEYQRQVNFAEAKQHVEFAIAGMSKDEARIYQAIQRAMDDTSKKIDEITKKREDAVGRGADKKIVARIINNRLKIGMPLQLDATVQYARDSQYPPAKYWLSVSKDDLRINSPFNTYAVPGLPPSPICNPGIDSIIAASSPTPNDYLYYISDNSGQMHYANTLDQHNLNVAKYLR